MTPFSYGQTMPGVEIHANAFETLAGDMFLEPVRDIWVALFCVLLCAAAGVIFWHFAGWMSYALSAALLVGVHMAPWIAFRGGIVLPLFPTVLDRLAEHCGRCCVSKPFVVRRLLGKTTAEKERYQKAIHFVAHEMRTPLQAIQGSSRS